MNSAKGPMDEDINLIEAFEQGDRNAFDRLLEKYRGEIYGLALRLTSSAEDAEDVAQQTFISALTHLGGFRRRAAFRTWLYRIAINKSRNCLRRRRPVETLDENFPGAAIGGSPERRAEKRDELERTMKCLHLFSEKQRLAVLLRAVRGMEYDEVGRIIGCSGKTAKVHFHYGVENLRKRMREK